MPSVIERDYLIEAPVGAVRGGRGGAEKNLVPLYWGGPHVTWTPYGNAMRFKVRKEAHKMVRFLALHGHPKASSKWIVRAPAQKARKLKLVTQTKLPDLSKDSHRARLDAIQAVNRLLVATGYRVRRDARQLSLYHLE